MSISTDSYYNVIYNGETLDRIGLSKTLNNYTISEIKEMTFCGMQNKLYRNISTREEINLIAYVNDVQPLPFNAEPKETLGNGGKYTLSAGSGAYTNPDGLPVSVIWLSFPYGSSPPRTIRSDTALLSNIKVITEFDAPKYVFELTNPKQVANVGAISWTDENASLYFTGLYSNGGGDCSLKYQVDNETFISVLPHGGPTIPYLFFEFDGWFILSELNTDTTQWYNRGNGSGSTWGTAGRSGGGGLIPWQTSPFMSFGTSLNVVSMSNDFGGANVLPYTWFYSENDWGVSRDFWAVSDDGHPMRVCFGESMWDGTGYHRGFATHNYFSSRDEIYNFLAGGGIRFKTDKIYKPIIQNGWVIGYTDNMDTPSDLDAWHGSTVHTVSPTPPTPTPTPDDSKDNEIDVDMSQFAPSVGFVNYIEMDYETAQHVASAFNTYNESIWNIGGDLFKNLISYKIFAVYGAHSGTIKNIHIAGHELEYNDAPINGNYIDDMGMVDLGTINVGSTFRFNDWRDFAPYTKIECFVPCCGWCQLPPWVMGRSVTGTMYIDIANGSCKAVIKAGKTPVAEIGGCVAVDVPFSSVATGAKAAGLITAITNGAVSAFNPTPQNLISGSFGILSALNANYTETKGVMGDGSNINGCTQFLIKVTRPASTDTANGTITDTYKHTKGIPTNKTITLAKGDGFTQITDANINGNMTAREKQMIVDGFRHGLIL